jgi:hypothetical protein
MKDPVLAIITRLKADAAVAGVVSTRVYRATLPTSPTFPAITVSRVDNKRTNECHAGGHNAVSRIQVTTWASTDGVADNLSELVADSLNRVTSTNLSPGVWIVSIFDAGTVPDNNMDIPVYMYHRDFMVKYDY